MRSWIRDGATAVGMARAGGDGARDWRRALRAAAVFGIDRCRVGERALARGQRLFSQGQAPEAVYIVLEGWLALEQVLSDGQRQILDFALPGSLVGHHRDDAGATPYGAECLTECLVAVLPRSRFLDHLGVNAPSRHLYEATVAEDLNRAHASLANIARRTGAAKIAHLVLDLSARADAVRLDEPSDRLPLTQHHLGAALGITNVYVSRIVKRMRAKGLIAWRGSALHVLDREQLRVAVEAGAG